MVAFLLFLAGLVFLLLGSRGVVENALAISGRIKLSPLIIGMTIIAIGTSLPEITISVFGGLDKATDLALGGIVGSNIANIGLIFGLTLTFRSLYIGKTKTQNNLLVYFLLSIIFFLILLFASLEVFIGIVLLMLGLLAVLWEVFQGKKGALEEDRKVLDKLSKVGRHPVLAGILFIASLALLFLGGKLLVDSGVEIAHFLNIPALIIGVTVVAIGTSLPELAVSLAGLAAKEEKLVVGNILGSNIFNILFGGGILGLFGAGSLDNLTTLVFFTIFSLLFSFLLYNFRGGEIPRYSGLILLTLYVIYLLAIFIP